MKNEFKPGDKARMTVDVTHAAGILFKKGQIVTVEKTNQSCVPYMVVSEYGALVWVSPHQIEPIDTPQFQVGDTVYDPVLFPGSDPNVPYPGKVVKIDDGQYPVGADFGGIMWYSGDGRYLGSRQPTLSKNPYRFVREEIISKPDIYGLAKKLDEILMVETKESLSRWLDGYLNPKYQPRYGEAVLVGDEGGKWIAGVSDGEGRARTGCEFRYWPRCIPFAPGMVGKPVNP